MKYKVIVHKRAARYLKSLPGFQRERIKQSLRELEDGITDKVDVKSMAGEWKGYYEWELEIFERFFGLIINWRQYMLIILAQEEMCIRSRSSSVAPCSWHYSFVWWRGRACLGAGYLTYEALPLRSHWPGGWVCNRCCVFDIRYPADVVAVVCLYIQARIRIGKYRSHSKTSSLIV